MHDGFIELSGGRLHYRKIDGEPGRTPLVFLHEGLGSVDLWREFPAEVARRSGHPALIYSRLGYGWSDPLGSTRDIDYMHREALDVLPAVLEAGFDRAPILIGHSDGASIAIIYAGKGHAVSGLVLLAPHVFVEDDGLESIRAVYTAFPGSDMSERMGKYHADPEATFRGWAEVWLSEGFRSWNIEEFLEGIECPVLLVQCDEDEYGSPRQLDAIEAQTSGPVVRLLLPGPGHSPHLLHAATVTAATAEFISSLSGESPPV